jgi:hypothetical protein
MCAVMPNATTLCMYLEVFVLKLFAPVDRTSPGAVSVREVASLTHKTWNDSAKTRPACQPPGAARNSADPSAHSISCMGCGWTGGMASPGSEAVGRPLHTQFLGTAPAIEALSKSWREHTGETHFCRFRESFIQRLLHSLGDTLKFAAVLGVVLHRFVESISHCNAAGSVQKRRRPEFMRAGCAISEGIRYVHLP